MSARTPPKAESPPPALKAATTIRGLFLLVLGACSPPVEMPRTNLVLISIDTLRPDRLGCYGHKRPTSPNIDGIARQGVRFRDVSSVSPWTLPSHASLLTGLYPSQHGVKSHTLRLSDQTETLATRLTSFGYRSFAVVNSHNLSARYGLDQGFGGFEYITEIEGLGTTEKKIENKGEEITQRGLEWIDQNRAHPFFLFLHYYDVHTDLTPEPRYEELFAHKYRGPIDGTTRQLSELRYSKGTLRDRDIRRLFDLYDAEIRQLDTHIGELLEHLDKHDLAANTLVVLTSDHGEEFMEHGSVLHGRTYFQEVIAIPLLMRGPGVPAGTIVREPSSLVDVLPTVLSLLDLPGIAVDGVDLSRSWKDPGQTPPERFLFAEADHNALVGGEKVHDALRMVRSEHHKLQFNRITEEVTLYDLSADPAEEDDLSQLDATRTRALLERIRAFIALEEPGTEIAPPSAEDLDRLEDLGY